MDQDAAIGGAADSAGRGIVVIANKWDLVKSRGEKFVETFDDEVRRRMKFLEYAPILHISALTGERAPRVLETIDRIAASRRTRIPTPALNKFIEAVTAANPPVSPGRKHVRILYAAQTGIAPPSFRVFYQRRHHISFFLSALSCQSTARTFRLFRHADHDARAPAREAIQTLGPVQRNRNSSGQTRICACYTRRNSPRMAENSGQIEIPKRALFRAAEVCDLLKVQPACAAHLGERVPGVGGREDFRRSPGLPADRRRASDADPTSAPGRRPDAGRRPPPPGRGGGARGRPACRSNNSWGETPATV